tara:strand:- start:710 stop:1372 length:663 start_codon:yes stop_codon:yes gene_type:complete
MATIVITGASRGIGFEFSKQFKERGDEVIAVVRKPSQQLLDLDVKIIRDIDVSNKDDVARLSKELADTKIDYLINNAGIFTNETLDNMDFENIAKQIEVNTIAPLRVSHALLNNLNKGSKLAIVSSRMGSVEDNSSGGYYGYRISKSGANSLGKSLAVDLEARGIAVAVLHPGFVRTDMTGGAGEINPDQAAKGMIKILTNLNVSNSGRFWHTNGSSLPW